MGNRNGARAALAQWLHARHSGYSRSWRKQLGLVGGVGRTVHRCVGEAPRLLEFPEKEVREPDFERNTQKKHVYRWVKDLSLYSRCERSSTS